MKTIRPDIVENTSFAKYSQLPLCKPSEKTLHSNLAAD